MFVCDNIVVCSFGYISRVMSRIIIEPIVRVVVVLSARQLL